MDQADALLETRTPEAVVEYDSAYIDGRWVAVPDGEPCVVHDSWTGEPVARVHLAGADLVDRAVRAADAAFAGWSATPVEQRAELLRKVGRALLAEEAALAPKIMREVGMPLKLAARLQVGAPAQAWLQYADAAAGFVFESAIGHSTVVQVPVGVVACVTPWNYPLHQITAKVAPALLAGCTVVLKPSELAPSGADSLTRAIDAAGFPPGVFNLLYGDGPVAGAALVAHPLVHMLSFTGSTAVGRQVARDAAFGMKRLALELGGKSAAVVLEGADIARAVKATLGSCFLNSGQTCNATTRLLVPRRHLAEVRQLVAGVAGTFGMGDPEDKATRLGPLASDAQMRQVSAHIAAALEAGAELLAGGPATPLPGQGFFVAPTVLLVEADSRVAQEEVFGPVLCVIAFDSEDEAVAIANGTPYGLAATVWGPDEAAPRVARRMRCGQVDVNGAFFNLAAPFGGFGLSGVGRENGSFGIAEFLEPVSIQLPATQA